MMTNRWATMRGVFTAAAVMGAFVAAQGCQRVVKPVIAIDGSSTVYPITEAVAEEFLKAYPQYDVIVGVSGTGGGFKRFAAGETAISNASRPIKQVENENCEKNGVKYIELPVAYDGLGVYVHPKNTWCDHLTVAELKLMWSPDAQGKITKWSQIREGWPDRELRLFAPGVDSGTFDYFTEAINGKSGACRGDMTASEDDNVLVQGIANDENGIGFFGLAYYEHNKDKLKLVAIDDENDDNGKGPIKPSPETVRNGTYQPLSRPVFIYVRVDALERPEVAAFVKFYLANADELSQEVGYIPLPGKSYELAQKRVDERKTGSVFGAQGAQIGVSIEELLTKSAE